jgi:hypothetical protein
MAIFTLNIHIKLVELIYFFISSTPYNMGRRKKEEYLILYNIILTYNIINGNSKFL